MTIHKSNNTVYLQYNIEHNFMRSNRTKINFIEHYIYLIGLFPNIGYTSISHIIMNIYFVNKQISLSPIWADLLHILTLSFILNIMQSLYEVILERIQCSFINLIVFFMPERKAWSSEEDAILRQLRDGENISKWSQIAKRMFEEYHMPERTGKQCRQRYHNHLDITILRSEWSPEEEQYLYRLHDQIGNKWAIIAQKLPGRTDNCVKNHFYSKMRKAIRKLNKVIQIHFRREIKQIKLNILYKLVEATDQKFKINPIIEEEISDRCCQLKNSLLEFANDEDDEKQIENPDKLYELALSIHQVSSRYRKRPKRSRRNSAHIPEIVPLGKFSPKYKSSNSDNEMESDQFEEDYFGGEDDWINQNFKLECVKEEEQLKDGAFTVPSFIQNQNFGLKFDSHNLQQEYFVNNHEQEQFLQKYLQNANKNIGIQNNFVPNSENMLGQEIERLNLGNNYNLDDIQSQAYQDQLIYTQNYGHQL